MMTYYLLARLGHWCSFEACCITKPDNIEGHTLLDHKVTFVMLNKFGDRLNMGFSIITQADPDEPAVFDQDGDSFPTLEAAIRQHADDLLQVTRMPGEPMTNPMRHETWQGGLATAFDVGVSR